MGVFVIATYRPKPDMNKELMEVLCDHLPIFREQGLVTDRPAYVMESEEGAIVEVFEWKSEVAIEQAHRNAAVLKLWERFEKCCDYGNLKDLKELAGPFPNFKPLSL